MPFIGIIAKENDNNFIKNKILKNGNSKKFEIISINQKNIENVKNIKFDVIAINDNISNFFKNSKYLELIISKSNYIILNADFKENLTVFNNTGANLITYGFNKKASITLSSVQDDNIVPCIQRTIKKCNGELIEEQEINVKVKKNNLKKVYNVLVIFTILKIFGENLQKI